MACIYVNEMCHVCFVLLLQVWLPAAKGKGLEITGTFARRNGRIYMELTFMNKAMQAMAGFAIQFNKNRSVLTETD